MSKHKAKALSLTYLLSFLFEFFNGSLIDSSAFEDQMSGGGGLPRVHVSDDHDVYFSLPISPVSQRNLFIVYITNMFCFTL